MMKQFLCVLVVLGVMASPALAGGGSKADATIKVQNNATVQGVATIVRPAGTGATYLESLQDLPNLAAQQAQLQRDGGKILSAGGEARFSVKAGNHDVIVIWIENNLPDGQVVKTYSVARGRTLQVKVTDDGVTP